MAIFIELLLIGVGLSMDAFAVSICKGLAMRRVNKKQALVIGLFFGGFQALMPFIGWALGNVIGSNIFNILFVLGIAATISPITFIMENVIDIVILVAMSVLVWALAWTKKKLDRFEGIVMLALYVVYLVYICMR